MQYASTLRASEHGIVYSVCCPRLAWDACFSIVPKLAINQMNGKGAFAFVPSVYCKHFFHEKTERMIFYMHGHLAAF